MVFLDLTLTSCFLNLGKPQLYCLCFPLLNRLIWTNKFLSNCAFCTQFMHFFSSLCLSILPFSGHILYLSDKMNCTITSVLLRNSGIYIYKKKRVTWVQGKQGAQSPLTYFQNTYSSFTNFNPTLIKNNHCKQQIYVIIQQ